MDPVLAAVIELAAEQDGCVTAAQCVALGMSGKRASWFARNGHWLRPYRGVYVVHSGSMTWRERARSALMYAGKGAALSHGSAAFVRGMTSELPRVVEVSVPATRAVKPAPGIRITRRTSMPPAYGRLPALSLEQTAVDLLDCARTVDDAMGVITQAYRRKVAPWALREIVEGRPRLRHRRLVSDLIAEADAGIESPLERRFHHDVERAHGLPRAELQVRTVLGGVMTRADRIYTAFGVRVELDGELGHPGGRTDKDVWRDNAAMVERDELTLRYRWIHVVLSSCETAAQVIRALQRRGWTGEPRPCGPHCSLRHALATYHQASS